jgi:hypothetical protein
MRCTSHALLQCDSFLWIFAVFSQASGPCTRDILKTDTLALTDTCRCDAGHKTWAISSVAVAARNTMSTARRRSPLEGTCLCRRLFTAIAGATVRTQPDQGRPFGIVQSATGLTCVAPPCLRARVCVCCSLLLTSTRKRCICNCRSNVFPLSNYNSNTHTSPFIGRLFRTPKQVPPFAMVPRGAVPWPSNEVTREEAHEYNQILTCCLEQGYKLMTGTPRRSTAAASARAADVLAVARASDSAAAAVARGSPCANLSRLTASPLGAGAKAPSSPLLAASSKRVEALAAATNATINNAANSGRLGGGGTANVLSGLGVAFAGGASRLRTSASASTLSLGAVGQATPDKGKGKRSAAELARPDDSSYRHRESALLATSASRQSSPHTPAARSSLQNGSHRIGTSALSSSATSSSSYSTFATPRVASGHQSTPSTTPRSAVHHVDAARGGSRGDKPPSFTMGAGKAKGDASRRTTSGKKRAKGNKGIKREPGF